jgi:hypothetical protein
MNNNSLESRVAAAIVDKSGIQGIFLGERSGKSALEIGRFFLKQDPMYGAIGLMDYLATKRLIDSPQVEFDENAFYAAVGAQLRVSGRK